MDTNHTQTAAGPIPRLQLSLADAAEALNIPQSTLELECRRGRGPKFYIVGRRKYTTVELIREWQAQKIAEAEAEAREVAA
ncbi:MerR family transcriptional regulator [Roseovarius salinarum]|uniref:hypothetical protein n=1 Tax=Roseovarius salinarum TaxID=1981892 RepID=UPI000C33A0EB|nr:hypothetical protein [Roseovarius salinarum]